MGKQMKKALVLFSLILALALASALPAAAADKTLINVDRSGLALKGYDPVAYFTDSKPVKGNSSFTSNYNGARYQFASADHKTAFDANPAKYAPAFGGYCAYGASQGHAAPISTDAFQILNDRLILNYDKDVQGLFNKDRNGLLKQADANWPQIVEKEGHH